MPSDGRVVTGLRALAVLGCVAAVPAVASAQHGRPRPVIEPPLEYARVVPEACLQLPDWVDHLQREGWPDTTRYTPERDRLSPEARAEVARCRAAMDQPSAPPGQWPALARAALAVGDDAAAQRWHDKYLASLAGAALPRRAWAQYLVVSAYADAHPPRSAAAQAALQALDAMGPPAARARMLAHFRLLEAARRQWRDTLRVREAEACLSAYRDLTPALQGTHAGEAVECVRDHAEVVLRHQGRAPAQAVLDTGLAVLPKGSPERGIIQWQREVYAMVGTPAAPIEATRWFHRQGAEPKPARGMVTLVHSVSHMAGSEVRYQSLRRLAARFAGQPFELIAQTKTLGFFSDSGAGTSMPPEREMVLDSAYFYSYARIPGMLAVAVTPFAIGADGLRREQPTPWEKNYKRAPQVLIDKRGIVRYVGHSSEEILARLIETLLAEP